MAQFKKTEEIKFVFFGSSRFSLFVLEELERAGFLPTVVITTPDRPKNRGLKMHSSPVKEWAESRIIECLAPINLKDKESDPLFTKLEAGNYDVFTTASYGKIIPKKILDIPARGTLNVHPSLLPKLRGPSPIETAILEYENPEETGVTIMLSDEQIDHGPILAEEKLVAKNLPPEIEWPPYAEQLETILAHAGGTLLVKTLPLWVGGKILPRKQDHARATFTKKFTAEDGALNLSDDAYKNLRKIRAFHRSPGAFTFVKSGIGNGEKNIRIRIKSAEIKDRELALGQVVPEGKREMSFKDFLRGFKNLKEKN